MSLLSNLIVSYLASVWWICPDSSTVSIEKAFCSSRSMYRFRVLSDQYPTDSNKYYHEARIVSVYKGLVWTNASIVIRENHPISHCDLKLNTFQEYITDGLVENDKIIIKMNDFLIPVSQLSAHELLELANQRIDCDLSLIQSMNPFAFILQNRPSSFVK